MVYFLAFDSFRIFALPPLQLFGETLSKFKLPSCSTCSFNICSGCRSSTHSLFHNTDRPQLVERGKWLCIGGRNGRRGRGWVLGRVLRLTTEWHFVCWSFFYMRPAAAVMALIHRPRRGEEMTTYISPSGDCS